MVPPRPTPRSSTLHAKSLEYPAGFFDQEFLQLICRAGGRAGIERGSASEAGNLPNAMFQFAGNFTLVKLTTVCSSNIQYEPSWASFSSSVIWEINALRRWSRDDVITTSIDHDHL